MSWLSQWLKEIIMIILLAAFIDLLLPNRAMQRYVKLMMSLIILLILLSPIIKLFDAKLTDELAVEWQKASEDSGTVYESLTTIQREAAKMSAARTKEVMKVASKQMEVNMKSQLSELLAAEVVSVPTDQAVQAVSTDEHQKQAVVSSVQIQLNNNSQGEPVIGSVTVHLSWEAISTQVRVEAEAPDPIAEGGSPSGVERVQPVMIDANVGLEDNTEASESGNKRAPIKAELVDNNEHGKSESEREKEMEASIIRHLTTQYLVAKQQITVLWK